jgi:hypothetical protein
VLFDSNGNERPELDGSLLSTALREAVRDGATDVFLTSHGWKGDIPAAISQYNSWIGTMAAQAGDRDLVRALDPGFKAVIVGVHWPSLPWGTEDAAAALLDDDEPGEFAAELQMSSAELVHRYAERIADTPAARAALTAIVSAAEDDGVADHLAAGTLPGHLDEAYQVLFAEAGLGLGGAGARPGSDQQAFDPARIIGEWQSATGEEAEPAADGELLLGDGGGGGIGHSLREALLMPVRQLSFWAMKHRACHVGQTGVHTLLAELQRGAPRARFHLMGHSFGCIVVSAAISGPLGEGTVPSRLPRPVHSLFLVQGALSLWSFAEAIPFPPEVPGYFQPIAIAPALVSGPIVTTRSTFDQAVGTFFPLAATLGDDRLLGDEDLPEFGGVGAFGLQGTTEDRTHDAPVLDADADYRFEPGHIYNIDASAVIRNGGWPSGAHSDIAHPEIAHLFWQAALSGIAAS